MVERSVLLEELDSLSPQYYGDVLNFIRRLKGKKGTTNVSLGEAAAMSYDECRSNKSKGTGSPCVLDSEDFFERR